MTCLHNLLHVVRNFNPSLIAWKVDVYQKYVYRVYIVHTEKTDQN